jgi:rRNA maturation protein Nop10
LGRTPAKRLQATCPHCGHEFAYEKFHAGFSNEGHLYCDQDETVFTWDSYAPAYARLLDKHPWMLNVDEQRIVESAVKPCPDGGRFAFSNPPLCPSCHGDISVLVPDRIYFIVTGRRVNGDYEEAWASE